MRLFYFAIVAAITLVRAGCFNDVPHKIKERIHGPPHGWVTNGPASSNHLLNIKIALPQPHFPILEQHLWEVSDPTHERYGAYLSKEETHALMAPHPEALDTVTAWLSSHGIKEEDLYRSSAKDWVTIRIPVSLAEKMLDTKYHVYTHLDSGESIVRTTHYSLPENLHEHIDLIQPTTMFYRLMPLKSSVHLSNKQASTRSPSDGTITGPAGNQVDASCKDELTIRCLRQLYNAVGYNTSSTNGNKIAVSAYLEQYSNDKDLQLFYMLQNPAAHGSNYTFVSVHGGINDQINQETDNSTNMVTQFAFGLTFPTPATFYSTRGLAPNIPDRTSPENENEPFVDWIDYVSSQDYPPQTIATGYANDEQTVPYSYANRVCSGFAALGVRGISLLFSTGDVGVGDGDPYPINQECFTNDGTNRPAFIPQFPASCPYVTAVGGTIQIPEVAYGASGAGFSRYFARPSYQHTAVQNYLDKLPPGTYSGLYNPDGRAFPDVAAQANNFQIVSKGDASTLRVGSTGVAAAVFASFIAMLNDARINAGKSPLGFLNQWLYQKGYAGLNDITVWHGTGCGTDGFNATVGWDAVTGLGTPNLGKLLPLAVGNHY